RIEGNYAGALELLTGIPSEKDFNPMMQLRMPEFSKNMQEVIGPMGSNTDVGFLQSRLYNNLSEIYSQIGDSIKGLSYQRKAVEVLQKMKPLNKDEYMRASLRLAERFLSVGDEDSAIKIFTYAGKEISVHDSSNYIGYLNLKALLFKQQNKPGQAIDLYEQIFYSLKTGKQKHALYYEMALSLGRLYMLTKQYQKADSVFRRNFSVMYKLQYKSVVIQQMIEGFYENLIYMNKTEEASKGLISFSHWMFYETYRNSVGMSEDDELHYASRLDKIFDLFYTILYKNKATAPDMLIMEMQRKSAILLNKQELRNQTKAYWETDIPLPYRELRRTKELIAQQYSLPSARRQSALDSIEERGEELERKVSAKGFALQPDDQIKMKVMSLMTEADAANIEFVRFNFKSAGKVKDSAVYAAFIFGQSYSQSEFVPLCSEEELTALMKDDKGAWIHENQLTQKLYDSTSKTALVLYHLLWAPLEPYLKGMHSINYSPAGILNNIALNALYNEKTYLTNEYSFHYFSNLIESSIEKRDYDAPKKISLWGNMDYDDVQTANNKQTAKVPDDVTWSQMKGISESPFSPLGDYEISLLKKEFAGKKIAFTPHELNKATENIFKKQADTIEGVLHISTHGLYAPYEKENAKELMPYHFIKGTTDPEFRSALVFSGANQYWENGVAIKGNDDGILTAYEIENLNLQHVKLVALSACESGLGDETFNEGNLGLQRAFKMAGAHYMIVSLWLVNAKITADFFRLFYADWLGGTPLDRAFYNAQNAIRKEHPLPYFWASFVLIE
ncbi:MAG: CHAT domain-containing protein, partial [Bacteroidota bacterium]|nr:CHAT domain-containing protein [Bacteroidota bacterium]